MYQKAGYSLKTTNGILAISPDLNFTMSSNFFIMSYKILSCPTLYIIQPDNIIEQEDRENIERERPRKRLRESPSYTFLRVCLYRCLTRISCLLVRVLENYYHHPLVLARGVGSVIQGYPICYAQMKMLYAVLPRFYLMKLKYHTIGSTNNRK